VVDEVRVLRLLRSLADDVSVLRSEADAKDERRADQMWLRGVKYAFITAIEAGIDVAQHVCSSEGWGPPRDNADAMLVLGRHGVLEPDLAERMRAAVGFRNVLVHQYGDVDDDIVQERLVDLGDLDAFAAQVVLFLDSPA
jgi:uncharacterized protein YutE (UPF0331/DUF86 family)